MFGRRKRRKKDVRRCPSCGSTNFSKNSESLEEVCTNCGEILVKAQLEVVEANLDILSRVRGNIVQRHVVKSPAKVTAKDGIKAKAVETNYDIGIGAVNFAKPITLKKGRTPNLQARATPHANILLQALNVLLEANAIFCKQAFQNSENSMIEIEKLLREIWQKYITILKDRKIDVASFYSKGRSYENINNMLEKKDFPGPVPSIILRAVSLAINHSNEPLLAWDVCQMFKNGQLPFLQALSLLPDEIYSQMNKSTLNLYRYNIPRTPEKLREFTIPLGEALGENGNWRWRAKQFSYTSSSAVDLHRLYMICLRFAVRISLIPLKILWPYILNVIQFAARAGESTKHLHYKTREAMEYQTISCFVMAAITFVPSWWKQFVLDKHDNETKSSLCAVALHEKITTKTSLVYLGKKYPWKPNHCLRLIDPKRKFDYWDYLNFLDNTIVADVQTEIKFEPYFRNFKIKARKEIENMKQINDETGNSNDSVIEQVRKELKINKQENDAARNVTQRYFQVFDRWEPSYEQLHEQERFLVDLFSSLLDMPAEKKFSLHVSMRMGMSPLFPARSRVHRKSTTMPEWKVQHEKVVNEAESFLQYFDLNSKYL